MKKASSIFLFRDAAAKQMVRAASAGLMLGECGAEHAHAGQSTQPEAALSQAAASRLTNFGRQAVASALMLVLVPLSLGDVYAQDAPPPPPEYGQQGAAYQTLAPEELDRLVAPIALYPDALVAQVLAASTYPAQVVSAGQFVQQSGGAPPEQLAQMADQQPWDPSVKALVAFPSVLDNLNRNMNWTTQLGNAYYNQPQDVMSSVQQMRQRAYEAGNLRSNQQLAVQYAPGSIVIEPVSPSVVYVPYYDPWAVYGSPIPPWGGYYYHRPSGPGFGVGLAIGFGVGVAIGAFGGFGWGYHNWAPDWRSRSVVYQHNTYISNSVTVINHGNYGNFDRNPQARAFNHGEAQRFGNMNRTTINNVTVNRTNVNNNTRNNFNNNNRGSGPNGQGVNGMNNRPQPNMGRPGQPGQFNNAARPGQTPGQAPGQFNNAARPGQNAGQFNNAARPGQANGQFNNAARPGQAPGQFNGAARPGQQTGQFNNGRPAQPTGQFNNARPAQPTGQFNNARPANNGQVNGAARPQAYSAPQNANRGGQQRPAPQPQQRSAPPKENRGGGGEHHNDHH